LRRAAAIGLAALVFVAIPDSAHSDTAKTVVESAGAAALVGILCSSIALNSDDEIDKDDFARRGWLVGVSGSYAFQTFEDDQEHRYRKQLGPDVNLAVDNSSGFNARVGYRCNARLSAEVEVEWLKGFGSDLTEPGFEQLAKIDFEPVVVTTNVKAYALTGRYQPFLLVGAGAMTADTEVREPVGLAFTSVRSKSDNAFAMRFGGGIDLYATQNVVVSLEADYVLPFGNLDDLDYVSISWGIQYRF
jgi:opacity protein-like surface antigen